MTSNVIYFSILLEMSVMVILHTLLDVWESTNRSKCCKIGLRKAIYRGDLVDI